MLCVCVHVVVNCAFSSLVVVVANLLTDLVYRIIDPRIKTSDD